MDGKTNNFLLRGKQDKVVARRYFEKSVAQNGAYETVTINKSGDIRDALEAINADHKMPMEIRL
jgi:putative transposase